MMTTNRSSKPQPASPAAGTRSRIGNVIRWHAEPVISDDCADEMGEASERREMRAQQPPRPLAR